MYDQKESYIIGQLYLKNRSFKPYPNGNGGVDSAICDKHAKLYGSLFDEQAKRHSLVFNGRWSSMKRKQERSN